MTNCPKCGTILLSGKKGDRFYCPKCKKLFELVKKEEEPKDRLEEESIEDSEDDGIFGEGDEWFPEEI